MNATSNSITEITLPINAQLSVLSNSAIFEASIDEFYSDSKLVQNEIENSASAIISIIDSLDTTFRIVLEFEYSAKTDRIWIEDFQSFKIPSTNIRIIECTSEDEERRSAALDMIERDFNVRLVFNCN